MQNLEVFWGKSPKSPEVKKFYRIPVCEDLERYFARIFDLGIFDRQTGRFVDKDGKVLAGFYNAPTAWWEGDINEQYWRGRVDGTQERLILVKNPFSLSYKDEDQLLKAQGYEGLGVILQIDNILFAAGVYGFDGIDIYRPVRRNLPGRRDYQHDFNTRYTAYSNLIQKDHMPRWSAKIN